MRFFLLSKKDHADPIGVVTADNIEQAGRMIGEKIETRDSESSASFAGGHVLKELSGISSSADILLELRHQRQNM